MNLTNLEKFLISNNGRRSTLIQGPPGSGKSSIIKKIHDDLKMDYFMDVRLGTRDPVEIRGIQIPDAPNRCTIATLPDYFPKDPNARGILLLDEFDHATPAAQSAAYQILLDRRVGEFVIPDNVWIIAACNSAVDGGVHFKIPRPIKNRVIQVFAKADLNEWIGFAVKANIFPHIVSFIRAFPDYLYFESKDDNNMIGSLQAFATPRSWFSADAVLDGNDDFLNDEELVREVLIGTVGYTATSQFLNFVNTVEVAVPAEDIIAGNFDDVTDILLKSNNALYHMMTQFESYFNFEKSALKETQPGLLEFIYKIQDPTMKATFFRNFSKPEYKRIFNPTAKEKDAMELKNMIIGQVSNLLI